MSARWKKPPFFAGAAVIIDFCKVAEYTRPMPTALYSFKIDSDGQIRVAHVFFGKTEAEAQSNLKSHADVCPKFGPAFKHKETVEIPVDIDEIPEGDEDAIQDWLDDMLDLESDEEEDDVGGDEDEEDEEEEEK